MLMAHPTVLRNLVDRYESLRAAPKLDRAGRRRLEDTVYTLCVSTGTRDVEAALAQARSVLTRAAAA
ncbi:DUF5133 domain-containing protein [Streptomyces sp. NPDC060194]|uniref:DUF5133 domain-containing protein n=1 Tax=Streptomyces sp. NPDC060194 TaxID=3347069 RepID=UPI003654C56F